MLGLGLLVNLQRTLLGSKSLNKAVERALGACEGQLAELAELKGVDVEDVRSTHHAMAVFALSEIAATYSIQNGVSLGSALKTIEQNVTDIIRESVGDCLIRERQTRENPEAEAAEKPNTKTE